MYDRPRFIGFRCRAARYTLAKRADVFMKDCVSMLALCGRQLGGTCRFIVQTVDASPTSITSQLLEEGKSDD